MVNRSVLRSAAVFFAATVRHWILLVGGAVFAVVGFALDASGVEKVPVEFFYYIGGLFVIIAMVYAFHDVRVRRDELEESITPKLEIAFLEPNYEKTPDDHANCRPFLQTTEFTAWATPGLPGIGMTERRYRIGVINHSKGIVRQVRAELTSCEPGGNSVFPHSRLLAQDTNPPAGEVDVHPSVDGKPSAFFDVVNEVGHTGHIPDQFRFCYANQKIVGPVDVGEYEIQVAVMGENSPAVRRAFRIRKVMASGGFYRVLSMESI